MKKLCSKCDKEKDIEEFNWKIKNVRRAVYCKECSRKYIKEHYTNNRKYYIEKAKKRNYQYRQQAKQYIGEYLLSHPCMDCGESDILVLEFDHRDRTQKEEVIGRLVNQNSTVKKVIKEIEKCDVRCSNCHRRKTEVENHSWKLKFKEENTLDAPVA